MRISDEELSFKFYIKQLRLSRKQSLEDELKRAAKALISFKERSAMFKVLK